MMAGGEMMRNQMTGKSGTALKERKNSALIPLSNGPGPAMREPKTLRPKPVSNQALTFEV
jgi:hypothetical protein